MVSGTVKTTGIENHPRCKRSFGGASFAFTHNRMHSARLGKKIDSTKNAMMRLLLVAFLPVSILGSEEIIMRQGDVLELGKTLRAGPCSLRLQRGGNLVTRRQGPVWSKPATFDSISEDIVNWTSGSYGNDRSADYFATVTWDGNLQVIKRGSGALTNQVVFTTHVFKRPTSATHALLLTSKCALRMVRYSREHGTRRVWTNIHEWLDNFSAEEQPGLDNVLSKGEYFTYPGKNYGTVCGTGAKFCFQVPLSLRLQHDCNLVTFVGHDRGDFSSVVWSPRVSRRNVTDCYLLVDSHDVALYEGSFDPTLPVDARRSNKYWSVSPSFFDVPEYAGSTNRYQVLIDNGGQMYLDWE